LGCGSGHFVPVNSDQINLQIEQAAEQAQRLETSREQLRKDMQEQHSREMAEIKSEISRRKKELKETREDQERQYSKLKKELAALTKKRERQKMTYG